MVGGVGAAADRVRSVLHFRQTTYLSLLSFPAAGVSDAVIAGPGFHSEQCDRKDLEATVAAYFCGLWSAGAAAAVWAARLDAALAWSRKGREFPTTCRVGTDPITSAGPRIFGGQCERFPRRPIYHGDHEEITLHRDDLRIQLAAEDAVRVFQASAADGTTGTLEGVPHNRNCRLITATGDGRQTGAHREGDVSGAV